MQVIQGFSANSQASCPSEFAEATIGVGFRKSQKFSADGEKLWHEAESVVGHCGSATFLDSSSAVGRWVGKSDAFCSGG
jgi:UDP-N-acetylglucosamine transferase subunit ALG13